MRVAVLIDRPDWHSGRLAAALERRGAEAVLASLSDCGFRGDGPWPLLVPGFPDVPPDAVFVRVVTAGGFEEVTLRLGVLHALGALGVPVVNDARAIERAVDKSTTSFLLGRAGVPTPPAWAFTSEPEARALVAAEAGPLRPLVAKPLFGAQGRGLRLVSRPEELPSAEEVAGAWYLQRYVDTRDGEEFRDWRVLVAGGRAVAAMVRRGRGWRTNAALGARCEAVPADGELADLAVAAAAAVGARYAGVDLIRDAEGRASVLEVNSMPAWRALQAVSDHDLAQALADDLLALARPGRPLPALRAPVAPAPVTHAPGAVAAAYREACTAELRAVKPGNVHLAAPGHRMTADDFVRSARVSAGAIADPALGVGAAVHAAVRATRDAVGQNTNLGILLLCAPLARAAMRAGAGSLADRLENVLAGLDVTDAEEAFAAIRLAAPGGLGRSDRHDVHAPATVGLRQAMAEAADRDLIARQYATGFADVRAIGLPALRQGLATHGDADHATTEAYLALLSAHPDTHVARRHGPAVAREVSALAAALAHRVAASGPRGSREALLDLDRLLKERGLNPGAAADLTVATLFAHALSAPEGVD